MNLVETLSLQANTIRNKTEHYTIGDERIEIKPLTVGQQIAIDPYLAQIQLEGEIKTPEEFHEKATGQIEKYLDPIRAIFAEIIDYDFNKLLPADIVNILLIIIHQSDTKSFQTAFFLIEKLSRNTRMMIKNAEENFSTR